MNERGSRTARIARIALMTAMIEVAKIALQSIPNVELVTFLFIIFTIWFGKETYIVSFLFVGMECLIWGMGTWVFMYLYIWPVLITVTRRMPRRDSPLPYSIAAGIFGLLFGALSALTYLVIGGPSMALSWWISGIPYDILHGISNFVVCYVLFRPSSRAIQKSLHI